MRRHSVFAAFLPAGLLAVLASGAGCKTSFPKQIETADGGGDEAATPQKSCAPSGLSKGPWTLSFTDSSIKIRWETCNPGLTGKVTIAPESAGGGDAGASDATADDASPPASQTVDAVESAYEVKHTYGAVFGDSPPDVAGTWYMHEAEVKGLAPATCYRYALALDASATGRFCTARRPGDTFRFLAIGDTSPTLGTSTIHILEHVVPFNFDFTLHGGDIEYYDSTLETWAAWFPPMAPLLRQGALETSIGNHELEKPDELEAYTLRYFARSGIDPNAATYYRFTSGGVWFFALDTEQSFGPNSAQADWLVKGLADASKQPGFRFSVVFFHRPLATCGDADYHPDARSYLVPYFDQYKVPLVIQAHMHGYERFQIGNQTYITTGGGGGAIGKIDANKDRPECPQRVVAGAWYHATLFEVQAGKVAGKAIDLNGDVKDSFEIGVP